MGPLSRRGSSAHVIRYFLCAVGKVVKECGAAGLRKTLRSASTSSVCTGHVTKREKNVCTTVNNAKYVALFQYRVSVDIGSRSNLFIIGPTAGGWATQHCYCC